MLPARDDPGAALQDLCDAGVQRNATQPHPYSTSASPSSSMRTPVPSHIGQTTSSPVASYVYPVPSQLGQSINGMREAPSGSLAAPARGTDAADVRRSMHGGSR